MKTLSANSQSSNPPAKQSSKLPTGQAFSASFAIKGIFIILLCAALYFARDFFLPLTVAFILALTLSPVVRFFSRLGVSSGFTAFCVVLLMLITTTAVFFAMAVPVSNLIDRAPQIGLQLKDKFAFMQEPMKIIVDAQNQVEAAAKTTDSSVVPVTIEGPGIFETAASSAFAGVTTFVVIIVLLTFLLASGDLFYVKLVQSFDDFRDKKRALTVAHDVERVISRYLFTITIINLLLGIIIGIGLYFLGMPTPYVWGAVAALANFMPFIGAILGLAAATLVALVSFDTLTPALLVALFYFSCTFIEGQFITPYVVGRRLELNAVAVFSAVAFWAWMWGIVGALIAVPILVIIKTVCDHHPALKSGSNFLSARDGPSE